MLVYWKEFILAILIFSFYVYLDVRKRRIRYLEEYKKRKEFEKELNEVSMKSEEAYKKIIKTLEDKIKERE